MKHVTPELRSELAAEYVLGTMRGGARRRFEQFLRSDYALRAEVAKWEADLTPMAERLKPVRPPDHVWANIQARIGGTNLESAARKPVASWFDSVKFWRMLGTGFAALATVLLATLFTLRANVGPANNEPQDPMMLAVLEDQGDPRMVVEQPKSGLLMVKMVKPWKTMSDQSLELWVIPKDGPPRSLGVISHDKDSTIVMADMDLRLLDGNMFALSKEPMGGSPTGTPTGKVVCKGMIAHMPPKPIKKSPAQI